MSFDSGPVSTADKSVGERALSRGAKQARRQVRRTCAMLGCFGFVVAFAWSLMMPHMRGPDEFLHVDVIYEMNSAHSFSADKDDHPHSRVFVAQRIADHGDVGALHGLASEALRRGRRPAFTAPPDTRSQLKNQLSQHPPVGWALPAIGAELVGVISDPADWPYDQYLLLLRFFNALHMAVVGPLLYLALLRFKVDAHWVVLAGLLIGLVRIFWM